MSVKLVVVVSVSEVERETLWESSGRFEISAGSET